jgi:Spy/CpxP family protein refolding chaperone
MLLAAGLPTSAQPAERQPWWKAAAIQQAISLTSHQADQLDAIYRESLLERRSLRRQLAAQQKRVAEIFAGGLFGRSSIACLPSRRSETLRGC